jgi:hypothetical protein
MNGHRVAIELEETKEESDYHEGGGKQRITAPDGYRKSWIFYGQNGKVCLNKIGTEVKVIPWLQYEHQHRPALFSFQEGESRRRLSNVKTISRSCEN